MLVVAIYFWAPMVWGWIAPGGKPKATSSAGVILEDEPVDPVAQANKARHVFHWEKIRKHVAADPHMTPAVFQASWHNPFRGVEQRSAEEQAQVDLTQTPASAPHELDPATAGLTLTSVAIGSRLRSATINGDSYNEGESIKLAAEDSAAAAVEFRLAKVEYHEVELERRGKTYRLKLSRAKLAQGDEIIGSGTE